MAKAKTGNGKTGPQESVQVKLPKLDLRRITLPLVGDGRLVVHAWDPKMKALMLGKQTKTANPGKRAKDPRQDYLSSLYVMDGGTPEKGPWGFPAIAFKAAAIRAAKFVDGMTMVDMRGAFHINDELVQLKGKPVMREDMVRVGNGVADIRYRGSFEKWSCELEIVYNANAVSAEQLANLFTIGGFCCGVGENRAEKSGNSWGRFHVEGTND